MQIVPRYYDMSKKMDGQMQTEKYLNIHIIGKSNESIDNNYRGVAERKKITKRVSMPTQIILCHF